MSRSGYSDDCEDNSGWLYMGAVKQATTGKRGRAFLRELRDALEAMPERRLIANDLQTPDGAVCAIGAVGKARDVDMSKLDPEDFRAVSNAFGISPTLAREIVFVNDGGFRYWACDETAEQRYVRVLDWVRSQIVAR